MRFGLHLHPESTGIYIIEYLFVTLSPCGFIAAEYVLLGRLARWLDASSHVLIPPRRITLVFVLSDVTTFLIQVRRSPVDRIDTSPTLITDQQAAGGCVSASAGTNPQVAITGSRVIVSVSDAHRCHYNSRGLV